MSLRAQLAARDIQLLQNQRVRPGRERRLSELVGLERRAIAKIARAIGPAGQAWCQACPPELLASTSVLSMHRGTLRIGVSNAASRYALNRWLRSGGERAIIHACHAPIRRITLVPTIPDSGSRR